MVDEICLWIAELVQLAATMISFIYGIKFFFKKGVPANLQSITMAMGCHMLGTIYHIFQMLTLGTLLQGFTPAYLGRIGFFLFFITASYGQMDRIVDDGSKIYIPSRIISLIAPVLAMLLYIINLRVDEMSPSTKIAYLLVWVVAMVSVYFNLKHAIIPNLDFGFIKSTKPYNILAMCLGFSELLCLTAWNYFNNVQLIITSVLFGVLCIATVFAGKKGVEKWTI